MSERNESSIYGTDPTDGAEFIADAALAGEFIMASHDMFKVEEAFKDVDGVIVHSIHNDHGQTGSKARRSIPP